MILYAIDCDETLETAISPGPVTVASLWQLRAEGHTIGICGNWHWATHSIPSWRYLFSFIGPMGTDKPTMLRQLRDYLGDLHDDFVMVGNDHANVTAQFSSPDDAAAAREAGWRFIAERDFAAGAR
jgi:CHAD domain-containing protein